ncbi:MAG: SH3 domain-containing protein [Oscillatoria princeps RMCB-10]|jgi:hypothetical protein|nr:SH3 domain-containing protein [Oscillatoria princeps RMCB-10]
MKRYQKWLGGLIVSGTVAGFAFRTGTLPAPAAQNLTPSPAQVSQQSAQSRPQTAKPEASQFSQFRLRLLDAVGRADAKFIRATVTPQTQWNYGGTLNLDSYNINSNQSKFWPHMDKALKLGCGADSEAQVADKEPGSSVWLCPDLTKVKESVRPDRPNFGNLAIVGQNVNVRAEPGMGGRVIGSVSNEYVVFDSAAYSSLPAGAMEKMQADPLGGWTPVRLRNGQRGWILNQYVYDEENDYRVSFVRSRGQWRLRYFLRGNGN